ncbi:Dihydrodipicolinate synthase [Spiromyces aspiralis]|uniref:Dihydrodipicolinate synthase n=1 Tax=Spiromyces aspiralis TaxID=68401 RepID=A0ACC1HFH7_9FUNG|nr:Dihydrodipicolinate synthase [Spiromyces aspiralis]
MLGIGICEAARELISSLYMQLTSSPLTVVLLTATTYFAYRILTHKPSAQPGPDDEGSEIKLEEADKIVLRDFTPHELAKYDGKDKNENNKVYLAIEGTVFDVTVSAKFYGPDGPYGIFAGRDASRGLAKGELDSKLLTDLDKPVDTLDDLTFEERDTLANWKAFFENKYPAIGRLVNPPALTTKGGEDTAEQQSVEGSKEQEVHKEGESVAGGKDYDD